MNPEQQVPPQQSVPTQPPAYSLEQVEHLKHTNKRKFVWGLVCLIAPTSLFILTILLYAIINFIFSGVASSTGDDSLFASGGNGPIIANTLLFLSGTISVITWLPGIIVGIVLLATRKHEQEQ